MAEKYYSQIKDVHLSSGKYVLVLPGWYPTWQDRFLGDFNQRHVSAAGLFTPQVVLYIVKDQSGTLSNTETRYRQVTESIVEITVMYPAKVNKIHDTVYSNLKYLQLLFYYATMIRQRWGKPQLLHSYIVMRGGLSGLLLSKRWKLPFILSENWTVYYPSDPSSLYNRNFFFRRIVKIVFKNAIRFLPVTHDLQRQVERFVGHVPCTVVPNVVDVNLFSYQKVDANKIPFCFIHVSTMTYQKNPEGLLRSFKHFSQLHKDACLHLVGPFPPEVLRYAEEIGLGEPVLHFTGPVSYPEVAQHLKASQSLVLFSRYENLPCVILEALCAGVPVISTAVGGVNEVINASNGVLVENENEAELFEAFKKLYNSYHLFDRMKISNQAKKLYSYEAIGRLINGVYNDRNSPR